MFCIQAAELLQMFIYPDSRTRFLEMLATAGLLSDLNSGMGLTVNSALEFWSSSQSIQNLLTNRSPSRSSTVQTGTSSR